MTTSSRGLAICTFADEKSTTPIKVGELPWEAVVALHAKRRIRPGKSGRMFGGYGINGTRCDANVPYRSVFQLDINTEGVKDKTTGRILEVTHAAPPLSDIRSGINEYEWCAASSHWHEPQRGVIKYRVVMLPDGTFSPRRLPSPSLRRSTIGCMARWIAVRGSGRRPFISPPVRSRTRVDAFHERNAGAPLPVDDFVRRGREILAP